MKNCVNIYLVEFLVVSRNSQIIKTHCMPARLRKSCGYSKYRTAEEGMGHGHA